MKRISLIFSLLICFGFAQAQVANEYLAAADKYFVKKDYYSAAQYYEKYMTPPKTKTIQTAFSPYAVSANANKKIKITSNSKEKVIYNLAECYRKLHYHDKAAVYYLQATTFDKALAYISTACKSISGPTWLFSSNGFPIFNWP